MTRARHWPPSPRVLFVALTSGLSLLVLWYADVSTLQREFWLVCAMALVGGDSLTTGLLGRYGLQEGPGFTRWACGVEPSLRCAFVTRVAVFAALFLTYRLLRSAGWPSLRSAATIVPVVFGIAAVVATGLNGVGMYRSWRGNAGP